MSNPTSSVFARRLGRIAFGLTLVVGALYMWIGAAAGPFDLGCGCSRASPEPLEARTIVLCTWCAAIALGFLARFVGSKLRAHEPNRLFAHSMIVPALGLALLLPITFHLMFFLATSSSSGFDEWVHISLPITGAAHVVFALTSALRGHQLVAGKPALRPHAIYGLTVVTSCIPFIVLFAIPPLLVAITALPCVPMLHAMARIVAREREELADAPHDLPRARVVRRAVRCPRLACDDL
jgi:hypothetical protein